MIVVCVGAEYHVSFLPAWVQGFEFWLLGWCGGDVGDRDGFEECTEGERGC